MEMVLFIGIQATGKSSFYLERFFRTHVRINGDMLKTRHREELLIQSLPGGKNSVRRGQDEPHRARTERPTSALPRRLGSGSAAISLNPICPLHSSVTRVGIRLSGFLKGESEAQARRSSHPPSAKDSTNYLPCGWMAEAGSKWRN